MNHLRHGLSCILFILFFFYSLCQFTHGEGLILYQDIAEYWAFTGQTVTIRWEPNDSPPPPGAFYHAKVIHVESSYEEFLSSITGLEASYVIPRSGHYDFYVRECTFTFYPDTVVTVDPPSGQTCYCSQWSVSTDPGDALILQDDGNYAFGAWRLYATIAPPGQPILE